MHISEPQRNKENCKIRPQLLLFFFIFCKICGMEKFTMIFFSRIFRLCDLFGVTKWTRAISRAVCMKPVYEIVPVRELNLKTRGDTF